MVQTFGFKIIGPYFYEGALTTDRYIEFPQETLLRLLTEALIEKQRNIMYRHDDNHNRSDVLKFPAMFWSRTWIGNKANV